MYSNNQSIGPFRLMARDITQASNISTIHVDRLHKYVKNKMHFSINVSIVKIISVMTSH